MVMAKGGCQEFAVEWENNIIRTRDTHWWYSDSWHDLYGGIITVSKCREME